MVRIYRDIYGISVTVTCCIVVILLIQYTSYDVGKPPADLE